MFIDAFAVNLSAQALDGFCRFGNMVHESSDVIPFFDQFFFSILGDIILHTAMVMEIVGRWQNPRTHARPGYRHLLRNRKKAKEKTAIRLFMG